MEIKIHGEMSIAEVRQAIFEKLSEIEAEHAIRYSRGATLYINPTNGFGVEVVTRTKNGKRIKKLHSSGPYRSAAETYDP